MNGKNEIRRFWMREVRVRAVRIFLFLLLIFTVTCCSHNGDDVESRDISEVEKVQPEKETKYLKEFHNYTYYRNFDWFKMDGEVLMDSVHQEPAIGVEKTFEDSFNVYVYDRIQLVDSFLFFKEEHFFVSEKVILGKRWGNAFDNKRQVILDSEENRILVCVYSRTRPTSEDKWPIKHMLELRPKKYVKYLFPLYENPPINHEKLKNEASLADYVASENLIVNYKDEYELIANRDSVEGCLISSFERDSLNANWNLLGTETKNRDQLKYKMDGGMHLWLYFLRVFEYFRTVPIGY